MNAQHGTHRWRRAISLLLAIMMLYQTTGNALAYFVGDTSEEGGVETLAESPTAVTLTDSDGETTQVDESWTETFPYGTFAFAESSLSTKEGEEGVIRLYRLGGSNGRATAYITYEPVLIQDEQGEAVYDYAVSADDVIVNVEEPQPIAQYQPVGKDPDPEVGSAAVLATTDAEGYVLTLSVEADAYQWQVSASGVWDDIDDATEAEVPMDAEYLDSGEYDYRCVYTIGGVRYCTTSYGGEAYEKPAEEVLEEQPDDIELNAEPVYSPIEMTGEGVDPYSGWAFEVTFADGEWVKEIHIEALTDELAESQEAATFTIRGSYGGQVLDSSSTLLFNVTDINESEPSTLGFTTTLISADKSAGTAEILVERVGGNTRPVSVEYATADGTAVAGQDYESTSGQLMFYAGVSSLPVTVQLIDDGVESWDPVEFTVTLSELLGDDSCTFTETTATVNLVNSNTAEEANLATQLYDPEAEDVSQLVEEADSAANAGSTVVTGQQLEEEEVEPVYSELTFADDDELSSQVYVPGSAEGEEDKKLEATLINLLEINFRAPASAWTDTFNVAVPKYWTITTNHNYDGSSKNTQLLGAGTKTNKLGHGSEKDITEGVALTSNNEAVATLEADDVEQLGGSMGTIGQMFSGYSAKLEAYYAHDTSYLQGSTYRYSYTFPKLYVTQAGVVNGNFPAAVRRFGSGPLNSKWRIKGGDNTSSEKESDYSNPKSGTYSKMFDVNGAVSIQLRLLYENYAKSKNSHENDTLNDDSMIWLRSMSMTRRAFTGEFTMEITTPNDSGNAPTGAAQLSIGNYEKLIPTVSIADSNGGVNGSGQLYVGSTLKISVANMPSGYTAEALVIYQQAANGTWKEFTKITPQYDKNTKTFTVQMVGKKLAITTAEMALNYKFRVVYSRTCAITLDLSPSLPFKENSTTERDNSETGLAQLTNNYKNTSDHCFNKITGVDSNIAANITYGYSKAINYAADYNKDATLHEATREKPTTLTNSKWTLENITNVQWICFNLSSKDLLLVNGRAYPGNAKIYLEEQDLTGNMTVLYYHEDFQTSPSAMKTAISWMAVYWDSNGNGKIDGYYNENFSSFTLTSVKGSFDTFCGYIDPGSINEAELAPQKNSNGKYCQYFIKVCYTMTPRSLVVPEGASEEDKAQVFPAFTTAINTGTPEHSALTSQQKEYRYLISGKTIQRVGGTEDFSGDNHLMYGAAANERSTVDIPLGGDYSPATLNEKEKVYTWTPDFEGELLYPYSAPEPITVTNSVAGVTPITTEYEISRNAEGNIQGYTYTERGLEQMNSYLASFTGTSTFALVTQEQKVSTRNIMDNPNDSNYAVTPDSVTLSGYSTTPDAEYLKVIQGSEAPESDMSMEDSGNEMSEFNVDMGVNLGSMELPVTDYFTILMDGNKIGFAVGLPLTSKGSESKTFAEKNTENWTQFQEFFARGNFGGDESYKNASTESTNRKDMTYAKQAGKYTAKSFSADFAVGIAFMFEYNALDNGYYFEGMTVSFSVSLSFRIQARLTVCPIVYFYFQMDASVEITTGLGVQRDSVEVATPIINGKTAATTANQVYLSYLPTGSATGVLTNAEYNRLTDKRDYARFDDIEGTGYYYNSKNQTEITAQMSYLASGDYFLTEAQYKVLKAVEENTQTSGYRTSDYRDLVDGYYVNKTYSNYAAAKAAFDKATVYTFDTNYKAFNIRFNGKLMVDVYTRDASTGKYVLATEGYNTGFISSNGQADTQVVLANQDGMMLADTVRVVLRPLDYDSNILKEQTTISYLAQIRDIRNDVYWKGISISPSVALEAGAGVGVELMKLELFLHLGLEATFLLGVYNQNYDPYDNLTTNDKKYEAGSVDSFAFSIGIGLRVVLLVFSFELDAATYTISYDGDDWDSEWSFLNGWVGDAEDGYTGVTIRAPQSAAETQTLYAPEDNADDEDSMSTQAYNPTAPNVPFQLSGYSTSVDAANLATDIISGSDYKVITAGNRDFIVYTISRAGTAAVDCTQLVMSELTRITGVGEEGSRYGLANPNGKTDSLYLVLDEATDVTGDLDFDVWVEETSASGVSKYTIHTAWVSYASATVQPTRPAGNPYTVSVNNTDVTMNADNYKTIPVLTEPQEGNYYTISKIDAAAYEQLTDADKAGYVLDSSDQKYVKETVVGNYPNVATAKSEYAAAKIAYESYTNWYAYYLSLDSYNGYNSYLLKESAANTQLKTASWSYTSTPTGEDGVEIQNDGVFSGRTVVYGAANDTVNYLFAPSAVGNGDVIFFGSTLTMDDGTAYQNYLNYQDAAGVPMEIRDYLKSTQQSTLDVFGTQSNLNIAVWNESEQTYQVESVALTAGQTLGNVEFTRLDDGSYYVAYTTQQTAYTDGNEDMVTTTRLFLRKVSVNNGTVSWGSAYLLRTTRDYAEDTGTDGVYTAAGDISTAYDSPYVANLSFLTGNVDSSMLTGEQETFTTQAVSEHTFLLFEMNGGTNIILDTGMKSITSTGTGTIYPFFSPMVDDGGNPTSSGKLETTICADGEGNVYAVYVGSVTGTTNNALFLSAYDPETNTWGDGTMLAMNNMDTYEESIEKAWDPSITRAAYLGLESNRGILTEEEVGLLFGEDRQDDIVAVLSQKDAEGKPIVRGDGSNLVFSNVQATIGTSNELLVITQGVSTQLDVYGNDGNYTVMPTYSNGTMQSTLGMYAISYGKGRQVLGNGQISFAYPDFSVGSELYVDLSAVNVGNSAFRGSERQPITATLSVAGDTLATWQITENVKSGQTINLSGYCAPLTNTLSNGSQFVLTLSEYSEDGTTYTHPTSAQLKLFTVQALPDLGVEDMTTSISSIADDGTTTTLNVSFVAANRGDADATGTYAQFVYATGTAEDGSTIYTVLDLTDSNLTVGEEELLESQAADDTNLKNGILTVGDLTAGYGRRISGTITVPAAAFNIGEAGYLSLKVELFNGADTITSMDSGALTGSHDEYNGADNSQSSDTPAAARFTAPDSVIIPMGTTTLIPVSIVTTRGERPVISAAEVQEEGDMNIGIINFIQTESNKGFAAGVISVTPGSTGTGVIHVYDTETNSVIAIPFTVTDASAGIDIFNDNGAFTFRNKNGSVYNPESVTEDWSFLTTDQKWGSEETEELPLRNNLSSGQEGATFSFTTVAESIDLYYQGSVSISTGRPGASKLTGENTVGGNSPTKFELGANPTNKAYTVTVTVTSASATFDRLVEYYANDVVPTPDYDGSNPLFLWSRSEPATASIVNGAASVPMQVYVLDNNGLAKLTVDGTTYQPGDAKLTQLDDDALVWMFDLGEITENGEHILSAVDISGNTTTTTLLVDWFNTTASGDTDTVNVPLYSGDFFLGTEKWDGTSIGEKEVGKLNITFQEETENVKKTGNSWEAYSFNGTQFSALSPEIQDGATFPITSNGIYWVRTINADNTWSSAVRCMKDIDPALPQASLEVSNGNELLWEAVKEGGKPITSVTINGYQVNTTSGNDLFGTLSINCSGEYTLVAGDGKNSATVTQTVSRSVSIGECTVEVNGAASNAQNDASIVIDLANATGGLYIQDPASGTNPADYTAEYEATLLREGDVLESEDTVWVSLSVKDTTEHTFGDLIPGTYTLVVRDKNDTENLTTQSLTVEDLTPHVTMTFNEEQQTLTWTASKSTVADTGITSVTINGYQVNTESGYNLSGSMPIACNGVYTIIASDAEAADEKTVTVVSIPIDITNCAVDIIHTTNRARNNGVITATLTNVQGATFNATDSTPEQNVYYPRVEAVLLPGDYDITQIATDTSIQWQTALRGNFGIRWTDLTPGDYLLVVRDVVNQENLGSRVITVNDRTPQTALSFQQDTLELVWSAAQEDTNVASATINGYQVNETEDASVSGTLAVTCSGLYTLIAVSGDNQPNQSDCNVIIPLDISNCTIDVTAAQNIVEDTGMITVDLTNAVGGLFHETDSIPAENKYFARYQAALLDGDADPIQASTDSATQWVSLTKQGYTHTWDDLATGDYLLVVRDEASKTNMTTAQVRVRTDSSIIVIANEADGSETFTMESTTAKLTELDNETLFTSNQNHAIMIQSGELSLYLPKGTLTQGFDVNRLVVDLTKAAEGNVVQYTDAEGIQTIVPWSVVSDGTARYFITGLGDYTLVPETVSFSDIAGTWGEDAIKFTALRKLFDGTGDGLFSPDVVMSRAMFVTVLWRMAGSPDAEGNLGFSDLTADWYHQAVLWAAENGIATGYNATTFAPNDPVTREQMCVFLCRFLDYLDQTLEEQQPAANFADSDEINEWAKDAVDTCTRGALIFGVGENRFAPQENATRMQVSTLLTRLVTQSVAHYCGQ